MNDTVGIGIKLNIASNTGKIFNISYDTYDQAVTNLKCLLYTNTGERIMHPDYGCNLKKYVLK